MKIRITESQLKRLINEQDNNYLSRVEKIDPSILDLINTIRSSGLPETTILGQTGKIISWVPSSEDSTKGSFNIFKVIPEGGIPFIKDLGKITYRGDSSELKDIVVGSQLYKDGKLPKVNSYGKTTLEQMNNVWSVNGNKSKQVLNIARQFVARNRETFKKEFKRVTRNQWAIKTLWGDNPQPKQNLAGSQYGKFFLDKLNPLPKDLVGRVIRDEELEDHLTYKVDNFNSEGNYPNITPPVPQPVKPGSGYPLS
jgi:hypothetical protein